MAIPKLDITKNKDTYRRLLQATKKYWFCFLIGILATALISGVDALFTWLLKPIIDKGFIGRDMGFIQWMPLLVVLIFSVRSMADFLSSYCIGRVSRNLVRDFRRKIFNRLLNIPAKFYDHHNSGHLLSTVIYNVEQVAQASSSALFTLLRESSLVVGLVVVMVVVSWKLFLICLLITPFITWVVKWSGARMRRISGVVQKSVGDVTHVASEGINGYKVIRLFGGQDYERKKFNNATQRNYAQELKVIITNSIGSAIIQQLIAVLLAIALFVATMPQLHITAGDFGTIISSMLMLLRPVRRLTMVNTDIQKGVAGADGIFKLLDEPEEVDKGKKTIERVTGLIEYRDISFAYDKNSKEILHHINFIVKPGQTIAIVGRSGSGKSTLVNLLPRFYQTEHGKILIDGVDSNEYQLTDFRRQFALVSQDPILFNDTLARNIAYGIENITEEQIIDAATAAYAMEFIQQLPNGLQSMIGQNGVLLSGGQRQRIAIARALLKKAPILILDEATSALDTHSERQIQAALGVLMKQCTTLVIAHRLSTIENADWIIVLDRGHLVEQGTHVSLLEKNAAYAELHRLQFHDQNEKSQIVTELEAANV